MKEHFFEQFLPLLNYRIWLFPLVLSVFLVLISYYNYLLFHTLSEFFAIIVGIMMFVVALSTYDYSRNHFLMYLATGYFWIAALDFIHTLVYKGMVIYPFDSSDLPTQFWIVARYSEALLLFFAPLILKQKLNQKALFTAFGLLFIVLYSLIMSGFFPDGFVDGKGLTPFKVVSEYIICLIFLLSLYRLNKIKHKLRAEIFPFLTIAIIFTICSELAFTFYIDLYGLSNLVGHIFKLFSFWLIFYSIIRISLHEPYQKLERHVNERTHELNLSMKRLNKAEEISHLGTWEWNIATNELYWSDEIYRIFGIEAQAFDATYDEFTQHIHHEDRLKVQHAIDDALLNKKPYNLEHRVVRKDGNERIVHERGEVKFDDFDKPIRMLGIVHDITKRKHTEIELARLNKELQQLSFQDGLTCIANRRMFDQILDKELERAHRSKKAISMILIDIDFFKLYNDHYGHLAGDDCLKKVASALTDIAKRPADLVARYGGEEFVLLLPETEAEHAIYLAEECCKIIMQCNILHQTSKVADVVTISAGIATIKANAETTGEVLIGMADQALYKAKESGRNRSVYAENHQEVS